MHHGKGRRALERGRIEDQLVEYHAAFFAEGEFRFVDEHHGDSTAGAGLQNIALKHGRILIEGIRRAINPGRRHLADRLVDAADRRFFEAVFALRVLSGCGRAGQGRHQIIG